LEAALVRLEPDPGEYGQGAPNLRRDAAGTQASPPRVYVHKTLRPPTRQELALRAHREALDLAQAGDEPAAVTALLRALDLDPACHAARESLAALLFQGGEASAALALLAEGLELAPAEPTLAKLAARIHVERGELGEAVALLERAAPPLRQDPEYHAFRAALYQRLGQPDRAASLYAAVLRLRPQHALWWMGFGISLEDTRRLAEAQQAYRAAMSLPGLGAGPERFVAARLRALGESP
jgi:MSHA biogenesis protein MshN